MKSEKSKNRPEVADLIIGHEPIALNWHRDTTDVQKTFWTTFMRREINLHTQKPS